jgi:hypothetical protein
MISEGDEGLGPRAEDGLALDAMTRERLGRQMRELYEPVIDEPLDPRLAELMQALEQARAGTL